MALQHLGVRLRTPAGGRRPGVVFSSASSPARDLSTHEAKRRTTPMVFKTIALATVVLALATAPADALSGGKRSRDPVSTGPVSTSFDGVIGNRHRAPVVSTSEPLAMLVVGLGLLGARLLRRRRS
jgi:hypothetical protein